MKQLFFAFLFFAFLVTGCRKEDDVYPTFRVAVQLTDTTGANFTETSGVTVKLTASNSGDVYEGTTDAAGKTTLTVPAGIYTASASATQTNGLQKNAFNGSSDATISVTDAWDNNTITTIKMVKAQLSQVIIKEIFAGGTPRDDGSGVFAHDRYIILYNNSTASASLEGVCLAMVAPFNSQANNDFYNTGGQLLYQSEGWLPACQGFWYFQNTPTIPAGGQLVIALSNAVNNTVTYSKSINFDNAAYYCTYDLLNYSNVNTYASPAASIPTNHYLKAHKYATASAWSLSVTSPGAFLFKPSGTTAAAFAADVSQTYVPSLAAYTSKKVPFSWVLDGVEAFLLNNDGNKKRFTANIDAGYVYHTNQQGYSLYRNVDKAATEAIAGNTGKLVYSYSLGTVSVGGSTDPSGIDAEASIKNGATIIYMDTNNSTADFHLRSKASLRTN